MNPLTVVALLAVVAMAAGQLAAPTSGGPLDATGTGGSLSGTGLGMTGLPTGGPLSLTNLANAGTGTNTGTNTGNSGAGAAMNQVLSNPMLSYGLMGGDNLMRAFMAPYMSRFGSVPAYYYLRGGMDKFSSVLMSDYMNRMLAQSTGMNPALSAFMTGQMFDAPDGYALSNMLFNGMGGGNTNTNTNTQTGTQTNGLVPGGAAQPSPTQGGNNIFPFFLAPFLN